jgi:molecular chaperone DnaJ
MAKDYYQILGVDKKASKDEIKKAFRNLAHKHHPDKGTGDAAKFKEASEAYSVLSDDKKRAEYDTYGHTFAGAGGPGAGFGGFDFSGFDASQFQDFDLGDIFGDFFGGARGRAQTLRGRDISIDLELPFQESIFGTERTVLLAKTSTCDRCNGNGGEPGTEMKTCPTCNGQGQIRETRRSFIGSFSTVTICPECHGRKQVPKEKCHKCKGEGVIRKQEEIKITIPPGINDGEMIRLSGQGEAISGGVSGDLYVKIHVRSHPIFRKEGNNLYMDLNIKLSDALLGKEISIETLDEPIIVKVPAGITFGELLRVKGKGVPTDRGRRGDLMIRIKIELPKKLSKDGRRLVEGLKKEGI